MTGIPKNGVSFYVKRQMGSAGARLPDIFLTDDTETGWIEGSGPSRGSGTGYP